MALEALGLHHDCIQAATHLSTTEVSVGPVGAGGICTHILESLQMSNSSKEKGSRELFLSWTLLHSAWTITALQTANAESPASPEAAGMELCLCPLSPHRLLPATTSFRKGRRTGPRMK